MQGDMPELHCLVKQFGTECELRYGTAKQCRACGICCEDRDYKGLHVFPSNITRDDPPITRDYPPSLLI